MKIVISENQSDRMVEIIRRIVSTIDFEFSGIKDFTVTISNENFPFAMYDVYLIIDPEWVNKYYGEIIYDIYVRRAKSIVRDKIKQYTGLDVYVGTLVK